LNVRAILLDLDGTLLDTVLDLHAAANGMLADLGRPPVAIEDIRAYVGRGIPNLVKRVLAGKLEAADDPAPPPDDALASFRRHYGEVNGRAAKPFPGVMAGLDALKAKGLPLGVITNKAAAFTGPLLERTGLAPYMSVAVSGDQLPRPKPDPMPVIWACGRLGVSPADVVLIPQHERSLRNESRPGPLGRGLALAPLALIPAAALAPLMWRVTSTDFRNRCT